MVSVDKNKCIGCGACVAICPDMFEIGPDGKSQVKDEKGKCNIDQVINVCPVQAISK